MGNNKKFFRPKILGAKEIPVTRNYNCCYDDIECWNSIYQGVTLTEYITNYPGLNSTNKFPTIESYLNLKKFDKENMTKKVK